MEVINIINPATGVDFSNEIIIAGIALVVLIGVGILSVVLKKRKK
ncbi:MAG: LPXTG cell wall anchor domain-containing protein [Oscillospiraceae bacterium]|nr:LPXTG cell wall anchor domain-containing protein [Oscillospiraceae bacterium]